MSDDLVERLESEARCIDNSSGEPHFAGTPALLFEAAARISSLERELAEAREALEPFADWGRLEELHGSTIGHADIADDENAMLVVGELQTHVGTAGDLRRLHRFLSTASQQGDSDAG